MLLGLVVFVVLVIAVFLGGYLYGRLNHRALILGGDTYIRWYPNPGIGVRVGNKRVAVSVVGGLEGYIGRMPPIPSPPGSLTGSDRIWIRTFSYASRRQSRAV